MRKKSKNRRLPKYVCRGTSAYLYVPYKRGQRRKSYRLCGLDASLHEVWAAHAKFVEGERTDTLEWLLNKYRDSKEFTTYKGKPKSKKTIDEQFRQIDLIAHYPIKDSRFGLLEVAKIEPPTIKLFLDWRADAGGAIAGNHEVAIISKAWNWARERGHTRLQNPCMGVTRNPKEPRQHYVTDHNYEGWLKYLDERSAPGFLYIVTELAYLCRMRKIECLTASKSQVLEHGFDTLRRKGSRDATTKYSPRLRAVLTRCDKLSRASERGRFSPLLILTDRGFPVTESGFNSAWQRHIRQALKLGYVKDRFTTHDLKRKGATDSDQDATISTGNSPEMTRVYDVSKLEAEPTK